MTKSIQNTMLIIFCQHQNDAQFNQFASDAVWTRTNFNR